MWERSLGLGYKAMGVDKIKEEIAIVDNLVDICFVA
jgi:hypothetical protein